MLHNHVEDGYACDVCKLAAATRYGTGATHARLRILASAALVSCIAEYELRLHNCKAEGGVWL